jgi:hypothetical protein
MRKYTEVLRLRFELDLSQEQIARSCSISQASVSKCLKRARAAGISWPLPEGWDKAGEKLFVDYAGDTIPIHDPKGGPERPASIFVAVLGASNYTYAEATWTQALEDWLGAHVRAFEFLGGCPELVVPDNTKTGVRRACRYEPDLNPAYQEMAQHYGVGVVPARPYRPRNKTYVSYCTSFRSCSGESRLLGTSAPVPLKNRALLQGFV